MAVQDLLYVAPDPTVPPSIVATIRHLINNYKDTLDRDGEELSRDEWIALSAVEYWLENLPAPEERESWPS